VAGSPVAVFYLTKIMIECFSNLVGIRTDCGDQVVSDSGYYLQDLPFINLKVADSIVTTQDSGYALMQEKLNIAGNYLVSDVRTRMLPYFKNRSIIDNQILGYQMDNMPVIPAETKLKGIQIKIIEYPFLSVYLSSLSLFVGITGDIDVKIYDLTQSKLLDTITVSAIQDEIVTLNIHKEYQTNGQVLNLFICYDATDIPSYNTTVFNQVYGGARGCRGCGTRKNIANEYVYAYSKEIPLITQVIQSNLQQSGDTGGLSITYSLSCSLDRWICQNRNAFSFALLQRAGVEILRELAMSSRVNSIVTLQKDAAAALQVDLMDDYNTAMDNALKNVNIPNDICFSCRNRLTTTSILT